MASLSDYHNIYDSTIVTGAKPLGTALITHEKRAPYVIVEGENPQDLKAGNIVEIIYKGVTFTHDPTDATSLHDGVTIIVTNDGRRYKADATNGVIAKYVTVKDKDLTAPPASPSNGDQYFVASGATGDWATKDGLIATYGARGWAFIALNIYDLVFVVDESLFYHKDSGGDLVSGLPGFVVGSDSVDINELKRGLGLAVESQTVNAPPASPTAETAYIVGPVPTGSWAGKASQLTIYNGSAWVFYPPVNGWTVFDKETKRLVSYNTGVWGGISTGVVKIGFAEKSGADILAQSGTVNYNYSPTSPPTTSNRYFEDADVQVTFTATSITNKLRIKYKSVLEIRNNYSSTTPQRKIISTVPAIYIDGQSNSQNHIPLTELYTLSSSIDYYLVSEISVIIDVPNLLSHTFKARWHVPNQDMKHTIYDRQMTVEEITP